MSVYLVCYNFVTLVCIFCDISLFDLKAVYTIF